MGNPARTRRRRQAAASTPPAIVQRNIVCVTQVSLGPNGPIVDSDEPHRRIQLTHVRWESYNNEPANMLTGIGTHVDANGNMVGSYVNARGAKVYWFTTPHYDVPDDVQVALHLLVPELRTEWQGPIK